EDPVVWRTALLRLAGIAQLQDARARTAFEVSELHALPRLRRRPPQAGCHALAARRPCPARCRRRIRTFQAGACPVDGQRAARASGPGRARPDAPPAGTGPSLL